MNSIKRIAQRPLALAVALAFCAAGAQAATITVDDGSDNESASCTLREAIMSANGDMAVGGCVAGSGADQIVFAPALVNSTITLVQGQLQIETSLDLIGSGQTIDAGGISPVLGIYSKYSGAQGGGPITVTVSDVTVTGGSDDGTGNASAGGISAISPEGQPQEGPASRAGKHVAAPAGNGPPPTSTLNLIGVNIVNNSGTRKAGGLYVDGMILNMDQSTVSGNTVAASGNYAAGGIYAVSGRYGVASVVTITNSTISGNSIAGARDYLTGGLYVWNSGVTLTNSTIAGNSATGENVVAGGISANSGDYYSVTLNNSTVSGNSATSSIDASTVAGGALVGFENTAIMTLANSIVAGNTGTAPDILVATPVVNAPTGSSNPPSATAQSSLLGSALSGAFAGNGNLFSDTPGLAALADNGGPTQTMALQAGSPAIDAGSNALVPAGVTTDQRGAGFPRVVNTNVDIGAFEMQAAVAPPPPMTAVAAPTLSTWAVGLLVALMACFGMARNRRRD